MMVFDSKMRNLGFSEIMCSEILERLMVSLIKVKE